MALSCQLSCSVLPLHINVYNAHTANVYERIYCMLSIAENDGGKKRGDGNMGQFKLAYLSKGNLNGCSKSRTCTYVVGLSNDQANGLIIFLEYFDA